MRRVVLSFGMASLLTATQGGCMALGSHVLFWAGEYEFPWHVAVYGGTQFHLEMIRETDDFWHTSPCQVFPAALVLIDLPFSFCVDTALLPITAVETLYMAVRHWTSPHTCSSEQTDPP